TGDSGRVSYACLVLDLQRTERGVELLQEIVLLDVERRSAEMREPEGAVHRCAVLVHVLPRPVARLDDAIGDHVHRPVERELFPFGAVRPPVLHGGETTGAAHERPARGTLRAQAAP